MSENAILIDSAGCGDQILGAVIGVLTLPDPRCMERRVPISSLQPPNFDNRKFMNDTVRIADKIVKVMQPDIETNFKVCSGYVLSSVCTHLRERGFKVEEVEATGDLQEKIERGYMRRCREKGVAGERLEGRNRFWTFLEWVAERPGLREKLVKTGWKRWKEKCQERAIPEGGMAC